MTVINNAQDADKLGIKCCANCRKRAKKDQGLCEDTCANHDAWVPLWEGSCEAIGKMKLERIAELRKMVEHRLYTPACDVDDEILAECLDEIERLRSVMEAVASLAGKDWLVGQLALGEALDGVFGAHYEHVIKQRTLTK